MLTINISGLEQLSSVCTTLSRMEGLDSALKLAAEHARDQAVQNFPAAAPLTVEPGAAPLSWQVATRSEAGWRREWGQLHDTSRPWLAPAADASRESLVRNAQENLSALARSLR
jgi:hypothetical protein